MNTNTLDTLREIAELANGIAHAIGVEVKPSNEYQLIYMAEKGYAIKHYKCISLSPSQVIAIKHIMRGEA